MRSSISFLLLAPDAWARGCGPWFTLPSVACPVSRLHSCCRSVSSLWSTCCHPGIVGCVALALALAWLLLRDCGSLGPRFLLPGLWWRCRSGIARSCSPSRFPASVLVPGPWARLPRLSPSVRLLPLGRFDGWFFGFRLHFLGISRSVFGYVWFLLFLELLASFCPGSDGRVGGSAGLGLHPPASVPPDPATRLSGWPHWVTIPPKLQSAFYSAGKYSVGTNGVLRKLKHIFPNTYQRINMMARLPPRWPRSRSCKEWQLSRGTGGVSHTPSS